MTRSEKLETDFSYMQNNIAEISELIREMSADISLLQKQIKILNEKISAMEGDAESRKPPHY